MRHRVVARGARGLLRGAVVLVSLLPVLGACGEVDAPFDPPPAVPERPLPDGGWVAGDHHVHSRYSSDGTYSTELNARRAARFGLTWMVSTDHGGPDHARITLDEAYPDLLGSRAAVPELIQFFGLEFNTPGADHSSLIVPHSHDEATHVHEVERRFDRLEPVPADPSRDTEAAMLDALAVIDAFPTAPIVIANHPSRTVDAPGTWGRYDPAELRDWNDAAPEVAVGMEGSPGHQAAALRSDGSLDPDGVRGAYAGAPTLGGFDRMTAEVGGFWDSMLGEGRRWWITANADSHLHWSEGGIDFWPGEYTKTWVRAAPHPDSILDGIRAGRVFVTLGDLVTEVVLQAEGDGRRARMGETLTVPPGTEVTFTFAFRDPAGPNHGGRSPTVSRVDLITGLVRGPVTDRSRAMNETTAVAARFDASTWSEDGEWRTVRWSTVVSGTGRYVRIRGTSGGELEPAPDPPGEDPWSDLWFYTNPVFVAVSGG